MTSFLEHFKFPSMEAAVKDQSGMTGILCAILSSDVEILETLVQQNANVNARITGLRHLGYSDTVTMLMVAVYSGQDLQMLSKLMALRADPNLACISDSGSIITTSWLACRADYVQVLLEYRADFNISNPLVGVVGNGSVETVQALLEAKCDPMNVPANGFGPMISAGFFGRGNQHACENMKLLLGFLFFGCFFYGLYHGKSPFWVILFQVFTHGIHHHFSPPRVGRAEVVGCAWWC